MSIPFQRGLVAYLLSRPEVTALVGDRIHPLRSRQGEKRALITYRMAGGPSQSRSLRGPRMRSTDLEITAWASDYEATHGVQEAVESVLDGLATTWEIPDGAKVVVSKCQVRAPEDLMDDDGLFGVQTVFDVSYEVNKGD